MKFQLDKKENYTIFKLDEKNLNSVVAPDLKSEFIFLRNEGVMSLIFDMSDVNYVDSSGLSSILTAHRLWKDHGSFIISGPLADAVKKLIEISKLESVITIIPTLEEAVDYAIMDQIEKDLEEE
jgi:anti-sigma B factor antagonist